MNWIVVKKFPLTTDLSQVTGFLRERQIPHRIYEEGDAQVVAVSDVNLVEPITRFLDDITQGRLTIEAVVHADVVDASTQMPSLIQQMKSIPVTMMLIICSAIGALLIAMDEKIQLAHWLTFQEINQHGFVHISESMKAGQV